MAQITPKVGGTHRWVIILGNRVFKIARIFDRRGSGRLFDGVRANRSEYLLYKERREDELLVPTVWTLMYIINVQRRGEPVTADEVRTCELFPDVSADYLARCDLWNRRTNDWNERNFCRVNGKVVICDYASEAIPDLLEISARSTNVPSTG